MIHSLSYDINSKLGFKKIPWIKKRVIYSVYMSPKETSIFVGDITLTYRKKIISGGLNIFPKWVDRKQTEIYYTKLENYPVLYKYNVYTGQKSRILSSKGMLIVSDVKGDNLLLTLALNDQPDIYSYNIKTHNLKRITKFVGIDVSGRFYDDGIVFISNRLGYPNVYKKNLDTGKVSRFIYRGKNHISVTVNRDKVIVSSRETSKAFSDNSFNLLLVEKNSDVLKRLTFTGKNLQPNFSDDGDTILFIKLKHFNSKFGIIRLKENRIYYFNLNRVMQSFDF
jgi:TolB protein